MPKELAIYSFSLRSAAAHAERAAAFLHAKQPQAGKSNPEADVAA
jgi:hypothetical protein